MKPLTYCKAEAEREYLGKSIEEGGAGWELIDDGKNCEEYNLPPEDVLISNHFVEENKPTGTLVGTLSALPPLIEDAPGDVNTFSLTCETPGEDDNLFQVNNNYENAGISVGDPGSIGNPTPALLTNAVLDFDIKVDYTVCVRVKDSYNKFYDKNIIVNLVRLGGGVSPSLSLSLPTTVETDAVFNNFHHHTVSATVTTDNNTGYTLSMKDNDEDNALHHTDPSTISTFISLTNPTLASNFTANTWGYTTDDANLPTTLYRPIPKLSLPDTIKTSITATDPAGETTNITLGFKTGGNTIPGDYIDGLVFTAITQIPNITHYNYLIKLTNLQDSSFATACNYTYTPSATATEYTTNFIFNADFIPKAMLLDTTDNTMKSVIKHSDGTCGVE